MDKPSIDALLAQIPSPFELTVAAAQRAQQIKRANREHSQPLQTAMEEIAEGKIEVYYSQETAEQAELPLGAPDATTAILNPTSFNPPTTTVLSPEAIDASV